MSQYFFLKKNTDKYTFSVPSRKCIISYLTKQQQAISREELAQKLDISSTEQLKEFHRLLRKMERHGQLIVTRRKLYSLPKDMNLLHGTVIGHRNGYGFLRVEGKKDDYYLSTEQMKIAIHGDIVIAKRQGIDRKGRCEVRIVQILVPKNSQIVGRFFIDAGKYFVIPDDSRLSFNIFIPPELTDNARIGFIVVVELIHRQTKRNTAIGKVIEVLGDNMGTNMAVNIALRTYDVPYVWPEAVKQQLASLQKEVHEVAKKECIDLRTLPLMTIDGEDANDFDDAVYCEKKSSGGWHLWVAIADVSYYVRPNTPLDKEAIRRSTSVYFPSQVIPMLPEILSNDLCSLNPKSDRLCLVCEMTISTQGRLSDYKFYEAVINSHARLTYNKVWEILHGNKELCSYYRACIQPLTELHEMYQILEQARLQRGGISFEIEEAKFIFNKEFRIKRIEPFKRNDAHKAIEECMILANIAAALFVEKHKEPALYRVHDRPSHDHITSLRLLLRERGLTLGGGDKPTSKDYSNMMNLVANRSDHEMLQTMLLRSMKQALYDSENRGHFGLALQAYAHFTSPIRRYPDITMHRAIKYLIGKQNSNINGRSTPTGGWHSERVEIVHLGQKCSFSERRADEAIRNVEDWLKCDFIKNYVGQNFSGIITSITNFGFFVRINDLFIDGLVHISSLDNDAYHYDNIKQRIIGESSNKIYQIGDAVKICVEGVHIDERKIDFVLIENNRQKRISNNTDRKSHRRHSCRVNKIKTLHYNYLKNRNNVQCNKTVKSKKK